jgi:hypothetical protein
MLGCFIFIYPLGILFRYFGLCFRYYGVYSTMPAQCLFFLSNRNFREYRIIIQYASPTVKVVKPNLLPFFYFGGKKKEPSYALPQVTSRSVETDDFGEELTPKSVLPRRPLSPPPPPSLLPAQRCAAAVRGTRMCTRRTRTTGPGPYLYCTVPVTRCNQSTAATGEGSLCRVIAARGDRARRICAEMRVVVVRPTRRV